MLDLVDAGPFDAPGEAEQARAGRVRRADPRVRLAADPQDLEDIYERLDVVDSGRLAEQPLLDRERRLAARLALALDRVEQRRLLAADVGTGRRALARRRTRTLPHHVGAEEAVGVGGVDRAPSIRVASGYSPRM